MKKLISIIATAVIAATLLASPVGASSEYLVGTISTLPTSGVGWTSVTSWAAKAAIPKLSDQNSSADVITLAKALVCARTAARCDETKAILARVPGTEVGGRTLALGRGLVAYVLAADLVGYRETTFMAWVSSVKTELLDGLTLNRTQEQRPNNWGTWAGASRIAADLYLGDSTDLARAVSVFRGYLGDRAQYTGFKFGSLSWQSNPAAPVGINPAGALIQGHDVSGVVPDDQRRAGSFTWPPPCENYVWESLQGTTVSAKLLSNAGYPALSWSDASITRAVGFLNANGCPATGDDGWVPWMIGQQGKSPSTPGKGFGFSEWLYR